MSNLSSRLTQIIISIVLIIALSACQSNAATIEPTVANTPTVQPSNTPIPTTTATATLEPTATLANTKVPEVTKVAPKVFSVDVEGVKYNSMPGKDGSYSLTNVKFVDSNGAVINDLEPVGIKISGKFGATNSTPNAVAVSVPGYWVDSGDKVTYTADMSAPKVEGKMTYLGTNGKSVTLDTQFYDLKLHSYALNKNGELYLLDLRATSSTSFNLLTKTSISFAPATAVALPPTASLNAPKPTAVATKGVAVGSDLPPIAIQGGYAYFSTDVNRFKVPQGGVLYVALCDKIPTNINELVSCNWDPKFQGQSLSMGDFNSAFLKVKSAHPNSTFLFGEDVQDGILGSSWIYVIGGK